ncbi:MAG: DUF1570 domain-containing protein [Phycisphaerales bacterium]|nr:DUF1570 domain-containing protein [Phycisphaerales bacterium]
MRHWHLLLCLVLSSCAPSPRAVLLGSVEPHQAPPAGSPIRVQSWEFMGDAGLRLETSRWDIRTTIDEPTLHARLPVMLESGLDAMCDQFVTSAGPLPPPREVMITCLLGDRRQWSNMSAMLIPAHAEAMKSLQRGGYTSQGVAVLYDIDRRSHCRNTIALAMHEGWHQYAQTALHSRLPAWLDEGLATNMEGFRMHTDGFEIDHTANRQRERRYWWIKYRGRQIPLADLLRSDPHVALAKGSRSLLDYYAQVWAFMRFMLADDQRRGAIAAGLHHAATPGSTPESTQQTIELSLGQSLVSQQETYEAWAQEHLTPSWWRD